MKTASFRKAALINAVSQYANILLYIAFNAIISRLLTPEEYGVFAIVSIFTTFFSKIYESGFGAVVIQRKDLTISDISSIYTFMGLAGIVLALLFAALGAPVSAVYHDNVYVLVFVVLAFGIFFNTAGVVPNAFLLREKRFEQVALWNVIGHFVSFGLAIVLALFGGKYYALVFQVVALAVIKFLSSRWLSGVRRTKKINRKVIRSVLPFTLFEVGSMMLNFLEQNLDNILVSLTMGSTRLGYYSKSYTLTKYPIGAISGAVTPVLHPILSDYQDDKKALHEKYLKYLASVSTIAIFVSSLCFCAAREIILILYGSQWTDCIESFRRLSLCIYPLFMMSGNIAIYKSLNRMDLLFRAVIINTSITCLSIVLGIWMGSIEAVALCVCIANWSNMFVTLFILNHMGFGISYGRFWAHFLPDIVFLTVVQAAGAFGLEDWLYSWNLWLAAIAKAAFMGASYLLYLLLTGRYRRLLFILPGRAKRNM